MYLGTKIKLMQSHSGIWVWSMSSSKYEHEAVRICDEYIQIANEDKESILHGLLPELNMPPVLRWKRHPITSP